MTKSTFDVAVYRDLESIEPIWREMDDSAAVLRSQWFDWASTWFEIYGIDRSTEPCPAVVSDRNGVVVMLLPLCIQSSGRSRTLTWMGGRMADQNAPLLAKGLPPIDAADFGRLWRNVKRAVPSFDWAQLRRQPNEVFGVVNPFAALGTEIGDYAWSTKLGMGWEEYYADKFSSARRGDSRRKRRRLGEIGEVVFRTLDPTDDLDAFWDTLIAQKRRRYEETGVGDLFGDGRAEKFYRELDHRLNGSRFSTHLSVLECGDAIIGAHWGVVGDGVFRFIMPSFAGDDWAKYSPGRLHIESLVEWACEQGLEEFAFGTGSEPYKKEWAEIVRPLFVQSEPHSPSARLRRRLRQAVTAAGGSTTSSG